MVKNLRKVLLRIEQGLPVDWIKAKKNLLSLGISQKSMSQALSVTAYGGNDYRVEIKDKKIFDEILLSIEPANKSTRSAASLSGNTHLSQVNGAMLAVWYANEAVPINRVFKGEESYPSPDRKNALIIENEECFLFWEDTFKFVRDFCNVDMDEDDVEYIYGSGNSITNRRIIPYLKAFKGEVYCLFDIDPGGLRIYANLISAGLEKEKTHYLVPEDLEDRLVNSRREATEKELEELSKVYGVTEKTDRIISALRYYKKTIEQESYRAEK
jgi:hypothetical protein